jgi:hypothetical protein
MILSTEDVDILIRTQSSGEKNPDLLPIIQSSLTVKGGERDETPTTQRKQTVLRRQGASTATL